MSDPAANEDLMKEYTSMKKEWGAMKSQMAGQERRLKTSGEELESKEKYIRKLAKEKKELAEALGEEKKELSYAVTRAETAEKDRLAVHDKLRAQEERSSELEQQKLRDAEELSKRDRANIKATEQITQLSLELERLNEAASESVSERERAEATREETASLERDKLLGEIAKRDKEMSTLRSQQRGYEESLGVKESELSELRKARDDLAAAAAERETSSKAAQEGLTLLSSEKDSEHTARITAEAELSKMVSVVNGMKENLESLRRKEGESLESRQQEITNLNDNLESASKE
jgi:chromosome segregation ATPase